MAADKKKMVILVPLFIMVGLIGFYHLFPGPAFNFLLAAERGAAGLKQKSVTIDGLRIEYLEGGKGDALLLLHGFGADKDNWTRFSRHLTRHFKVIAPDLPGFGESSADQDLKYTIDAQVERLKAFMSGLDIQTFHLGGNSMGGNIAGVYASKYPDQVKSLILIAPGGVASAETSELDRYLKEGNNPLIAKSSEEYDRLLDFVFLERPFIPGAVKKHLAQKAIERKDLNIAIFKQFNKTPDTLPLEVITKGLAVPTLIVWGADDRVLHVSGAKLLNAVIPGSRLAVMDHVGHLPMVEKPKETAGLCLNFIKRQP